MVFLMFALLIMGVSLVTAPLLIYWTLRKTQNFNYQQKMVASQYPSLFHHDNGVRSCTCRPSNRCTGSSAARATASKSAICRPAPTRSSHISSAAFLPTMFCVASSEVTPHV